MPGIVDSLVGARVGSRILAALAPRDAYGVEGQPAAGIGPTDTIVVLLDVKAAKDVLQHAVGTAVAPKAGLPTVRVDASGRPAITLPKGAPPSALVVQPLVLGKGATIARGSQVRAQYLGVIWPGGREFDSSWRRGTAAGFTVGRGEIVAGLDRGPGGADRGQPRVGRRPARRRLRRRGQPRVRRPGSDTLVFVVDILDAT